MEKDSETLKTTKGNIEEFEKEMEAKFKPERATEDKDTIVSGPRF